MKELQKMTREQFAAYANPYPERAPEEARSVRYYLQFWPYFHEKRWFVSWNWPAFAFGFIWFFYRRMYIFGTAAFLLFLAVLGANFVLAGQVSFLNPDLAPITSSMRAFWATLFVRILPNIFLGLGASAFMASYANALYFDHARRRLAENPKAQGGTNRWLPATLIIFWVSLCIAFMMGAVFGVGMILKEMKAQSPVHGTSAALAGNADVLEVGFGDDDFPVYSDSYLEERA